MDYKIDKSYENDTKKISHGFLFHAVPEISLIIFIIKQDEKANANNIISSILAFEIFGFLLLFQYQMFCLDSGEDRHYDPLWALLLSLPIIAIYGFWLCYCVHNNFDFQRRRSLRPGIGV